jgi:hypothetical protein
MSGPFFKPTTVYSFALISAIILAVSAIAAEPTGKAAKGGTGKPPASDSPQPQSPSANQSPPSAPVDRLNYPAIYEDLTSGQFWLTLLIALVFGALGGVAYGLQGLPGGASPPAQPAPPLDTGRGTTGQEAAANVENGGQKECRVDEGPATARPGRLGNSWARGFIGALAAVAVLYFINPQAGIKLVALSIITGSAGMSLFQALQARVEAVVRGARLAATAEFHEAILSKLDTLPDKSFAASVASLQTTPTAQLQEVRARAEDTDDLLSRIRALAEAGRRVAEVGR